MIKKLSITFGCLLSMAGLSFGQASFSFNDNNGTANAGSYNPTDTVTIDFFGTYTGAGVADGFSLWLQVPTTNGFSSAISITSSTVFQFSDKNQSIYPKNFTDAVGAQGGYLSDKQGTLSGDLGATSNAPAEQFTGTKLLANYTFSLTNAAPGTYVLLTTTLSPKGSGISNDSFSYFNAPAASYTFTVVPEPSTWSLVGVGALGAVGFGILRRRQRA